MRSFLAVFAGYCSGLAAFIVFLSAYLLIVERSWVAPLGLAFQLFTLGSGVIAGVSGAYVTTLVARQHPIAHALALGIVCQAIAIAAGWATLVWPLSWFFWTLLALPIPVTLLGGWIGKVRAAKHAPPPAAMKTAA